MNSKDQIRVTQQREFAAHHMLLRCAGHALLEAKKGNPGSFNHSLAAITFSALAMEALGNAIGARLIAQWDDYESLNPYAKLRFLAERLGVNFDLQLRPWSTLKWLHRFRNMIAHPRSEAVNVERIVPVSKAETTRRRAPDSKLEREISVGNAEKAVGALNEVMHLLCDKLSPEMRFGLNADAWTSSSELID